jgi:hypothetical protein
MSMGAVSSSRSPRPGVKGQRAGAREFEKLARTDCVRQTAILLNNADPADIMRHVLGRDPREGLSPIALRAGVVFERRLLDDNAGLLLSAYRELGRLARSDVGVVNTTDIIPAGDPARSARRWALTQRILQEKLRGRSSYALVLKPLFLITAAGHEYFIEPDYLIASRDDPMFGVGEIKSYYDLDGLTEKEDLRSALRQAAVAFLALRETLICLGVDPLQVNALAPARVDLVLRRVGTRMPALRNMSVRGEATTIRRAFHAFPTRLAEASAALSASGLPFDLSDPSVITAIPHSFRPDCRNFCGLYANCRDEAVGRGDLATLGPAAVAHLAAAGSVHRALDLLNGAPPRSSEEAALQAALRATEDEWKRARSA